MMRHNDIQAWEAFVTTVRTAGLSQAARSLGTTLSNHVRLLKELELSLDGGPLFARRQNPVELTPFGRRVFEVGTKLVDTHSTLLGLIRKDCDVVSGIVRLGMPDPLFNLLLDACVKFKELHRTIQLEIFNYSELPPINFMKPGRMLDAVLGYGFKDSCDRPDEMCIGECFFFPLMSPGYLEKHGMPRTTKDLRKHTLLTLDQRLVQNSASFMDIGEQEIFRLFSQSLSFPTASALISAALHGRGILYGGQSLYYSKYVQTGQLIVMHHLWRFPKRYLYLYINPRSVRLRRVQVVTDYIRTVMQRKMKEAASCFNSP